MKKLKFLSFLLSLLVITSTSCKKDNPDDNTGGGNDNPPSTKKCYITKITEDDGSYSQLTYNSNHKIIKVTDFNSNGTPENSYISFSYNNDGTLNVVLIHDDNNNQGKYVFHYKQSKPDSAYFYDKTGTGWKKEGTFAITMDGNKLSQIIIFAENNGQNYPMQKFSYTYTGDNLTKKETYSMDTTNQQYNLDETMLYENDTKNNPQHGIGVDFLFLDDNFISLNNYTKITYKDKNGNVNKGLSYNITYEYNSNDYPTKKTAKTFDGSETDVALFTYDCP